MSKKLRRIYVEGATRYHFKIEYEEMIHGFRKINLIDIELDEVFFEGDVHAWLSETEELRAISDKVRSAIDTMADVIRQRNGDFNYEQFFAAQYQCIVGMGSDVPPNPGMLTIEYKDGGCIIYGGYTSIGVFHDTVDYNYGGEYMDDIDPAECIAWTPLILALRKAPEMWPGFALVGTFESMSSLLSYIDDTSVVLTEEALIL